MMKILIPLRYLITLGFFLFFIPKQASAYSVLTHEALIDASWEKHILPLLKQKYPNATPEELKIAHSYTYGGALIADIGYSPFGSVYFTNLAHYVRSGDFVEAMLAEAQNLNEYAFAVGSLCHYMADQYGHSLGTNRVVPVVYSAMKKKFGPVVTYGENHITHSHVELSFDVLQTARGNYASQAYHDFIGFNVAKPVLERAFLKTYGQDINVVFGNLDLAISTYRWAVKTLMPTITKTAWALRKDDIRKVNASANARNFHYRMTRKAYQKEFGSSRQRPSFGVRVFTFFISILPKVGPLKEFDIQDPGPKGEKLFIQSFDTVLMHYHTVLATLSEHDVDLKDVDYDTGQPTNPGEYELADETYNELTNKLETTKFNDLTAPLKQNIINFYGRADTAAMAQRYHKTWKKTALAINQIRQAATVSTDSLKTAKGINYRLPDPVKPANK